MYGVATGYRKGCPAVQSDRPTYEPGHVTGFCPTIEQLPPGASTPADRPGYE